MFASLIVIPPPQPSPPISNFALGDKSNAVAEREKASVLMQRLSYPIETVLSSKITRNRIVLLFKDSPRKP